MPSGGARFASVLRVNTLAIARGALDALFTALQRRGYTCLGPTIRDHAIVIDEVASTRDLPEGWTDEHAPGSYRLRRRDDRALFGYVVGPNSWKRWLFLPEERLWSIRRAADEGFVATDAEPGPATRYAFIGARGCELRAIQIQDVVFGGGATAGAFPDPGYTRRRADVFVVAVSCVVTGATCFCASMGTGPRATTGYDVRLVELVGDEHVFLVDSGTERGRELVAELPTRAATAAELAAAEGALDRASHQLRAMDAGVRELLANSLESTRWDEIATRCLSCANCTLACPTCFCSSVEDVSDVSGEHAERWRRWDSCFNPGFSYLHGGDVRASTRARYRQWISHKLSTWFDQFGSSGCVGCGRCITWCPVGIDITEEVGALRRATP